MTPDRATLEALLARVERAEGPDREIDLDLARVLVPDVIVLRQRDDDSGSDPYTHWTYTASIDAGLALVGRRLPDDVYHLVNDFGEYNRAELHNTFRGNVSGIGDTMPLAILDALLRAEIARIDEEAGRG